MILIDAPKELDFYADFKYISFIKFSLTIKGYEPEKICLILKNMGKHPPKSHIILTKITPSHSAYQRTPLQKYQAPIYKNGVLRIFCQKTDHGFVFFPGVIVSTQWSQNVTKGLILMEMKSSSAFFSNQKLEGTQAPSHAHFFPKSTDENFEIAILFSIVKKHNKMYLGTTYSPIVPGEGAASYKL